MERVSLPESVLEPYPKCWAVIVGINYTDSKLTDADRKVVPALRNAENDAKAVAELLKKHYGYKEECIRLLIGKKGTRDAILSAIGDDFLRNKSKVSEKDSVLFFFAGHGVHLEKDNRSGELIPWDVQVAGELPRMETCIKLQSLTEDYLKSSPARHKLIILDCCHSGDIFTQSVQAKRRITTMLRVDAGLFQSKAFQAIASCRREQQASDGKGGHAPFTAAMLNALTVIPCQQGTRDPIKASDLFTFMQAELRSAPAIDQSAELGWLTPDQGEFHFFPDPKSNWGGCPGHTDDEMLKAIAMAPGSYGAWWFDEMPWFMPSLRSRILANVDKPRGRSADWVKKHQLERSAREVLLALENEPGDLAKLRVGHLKLLLDPSTRQDPDKAFKQIASELREPKGVTLEASDYHLLAVIEHRVGKKAREIYEKALAAYDLGLKSGRKQDAALRLLCLADLGQFELQQQNYDQAALEFQRALEQRVLCPVPFQIYVLSNEAYAWQQLGCWGEANAKLDQVIRLAPPLADPKAGSPLTAFAYNRRAWAYMEQWNFFEAVEAFKQADKHLPQENDREAMIIRFHNRHGVAMARRFTGDPEGALADYRRLSAEIREKFSKLRLDSGVEQNFGEIRERLVQRLINTLDRQADCNLYRENGDLKEASDDLRRAIRITDYLPPSQRNPTKAVLLYKQALALGRRSPYQDLELAAVCIREADELVKTLSNDQQVWVGFYSRLATAVVQMGTEIHLAEEEPGGKAGRHDKCVAAIAGLRQTLNDLRPKLNRSIHRDHLEVLFFAGQCLIAEDLVHADRYHLLADAEMLLMLCRQAMRNHHDPHVTQLYLRQHFDSVIRAMIAAKPKHVQGIIEAVYEARMGRHYDKPERPAPCLVIYHLDGRFHAFLDVPGGISKCYLFDEEVSLESLRRLDAGRKAALPRQLRTDLAALKLDKVCFPEVQPAIGPDANASLHVRWSDPVRSLGLPPKAAWTNIKADESEFSPGTKTAMYPPSYISAFPFELPGFRLLETSMVPPASNFTPKE